jgi:hypothetical protein
MAEVRETFGPMSKTDLGIVCDECWKKLMAV